MKYPPGPLRIVILVVNFMGLALLLAGGILSLYYKNDPILRHEVAGRMVSGGFLLSGIGSVILVASNYRRRTLFK